MKSIPDNDRRAEEESPRFMDAFYNPKDQSPNTPRVYSYSIDDREESRESDTRSRFGTVISLCLACIILGLGLGTIHSRETASVPTLPMETVADTVRSTPMPTAIPSSASASGTALTSSEIYDRALQQVVGVELTDGEQKLLSSGSGFVYSRDGYILTNYHVIRAAAEEEAAIRVILPGGEKCEAATVGYEREESDLAVLKVDAGPLTPAPLGDSRELKVGERIYAVGNPLGELAYTMTGGMISAMDREVTEEDETTGELCCIRMFQIDAAVNAGNSGGPVYNDRGQTVGMVTAKCSGTGVEGLSFAIPVNDMRTLADEIIENGYVRGKPYLGIVVQTVTPAVADYYNRCNEGSMVPGAQVYAMDEQGCAFLAGLQRGDIIIRFGEEAIASAADLTAAKRAFRAGDETVIAVFRAGKVLEVPVVLDEAVPGDLGEDTDPFFRQFSEDRRN